MTTDPFASLIDDCHCSASQSSLLDRIPFVRQHDFPDDPDSSFGPAVPASPDTAAGIIAIGSAPETPLTGMKDVEDAFKTPPEEATRIVSSSQVSAASAASTFAGWSKSGDCGSGNSGIAVVDDEEEVDSGVPSVGNKLGFVGLKRGELVEVVDDGKVKVKEVEVSVGDILKRFQGGRKREFDVSNPRVIESPLKKMKSIDRDDNDDIDGSALGDVQCTQEVNIGTDEEDEEEEDMEEEGGGGEEEGGGGEEEFSEEDEVCSAKKKLEFCEASDMKFEHDKDGGSSGNSDMGTGDVDGYETEDYDEDEGRLLANDAINDNDDLEKCSAGETERIEVIIEQGEESLSRIRGMENKQSGREVVVTDEDVNENGESGKEPVVAKNAQNNVDEEQKEVEVVAEQERSVPSSGIGRTKIQNAVRDGGNPELKEGNYSGRMNIILEALKLLAEAEPIPYGHVSEVNIFETAKRHGMTFPRPKWWDNGVGNEILED